MLEKIEFNDFCRFYQQEINVRLTVINTDVYFFSDLEDNLDT